MQRGAFFHRSTIARLAAAAIFVFFVSYSASAQSFDHTEIGVGAGFSSPVYSSGSSLNYGWNANVRGGIAINPEFSTDLDFTYYHSRFTDQVLSQFGEPDGGIGIWSLTFNPVIHLAPQASHFRPYVTAGYGLYHFHFDVSHPATVQTIYCSGFFGCFPALVGTNAVVASNSTYRSGFNAGLGFDIPMGEGKAGFFAEARYNQMFMGHDSDISYIPVTFGFRW
ncbi:MAG: outer membrane beta-barrel protein [Candidatus Acidiferrales bacterium]